MHNAQRFRIAHRGELVSMRLTLSETDKAWGVLADYDMPSKSEKLLRACDRRALYPVQLRPWCQSTENRRGHQHSKLCPALGVRQHEISRRTRFPRGICKVRAHACADARQGILLPVLLRVRMPSPILL